MTLVRAMLALPGIVLMIVGLSIASVQAAIDDDHGEWENVAPHAHADIPAAASAVVVTTTAP